MGKIELERVEEGREVKVVDDLIKKSVMNVFGRYFSAKEFDDLVTDFDQGLVVEAGSTTTSSHDADRLPPMTGRAETIRRIDPAEEPAAVAAAIEFVLEGLQLNRRLNRDSVDGKYRYRK